MRPTFRNWPFFALALAVAVAVHLGTVHALPHFVMSRTLARMGAVNTIHHGKRPDAQSRGVVRPSPDLLYSVCPYDLSRGTLHVSAPVPPGTYWSVSAFDDDTNNFFVENDRQAKGRVDFLIVSKDFHGSGGLPTVVSPSARGLVLFRTLVGDEEHAGAIDAQRRKANCAIFHATR